MTEMASPGTGRQPAPALLRLCEFLARQVALELADQLLGDAAGGGAPVGEITLVRHPQDPPRR